MGCGRYKMGTDDDAYMMSLGIEQMLGNLLLGTADVSLMTPSRPPSMPSGLGV